MIQIFFLLNEGNRYESYINSQSITESFTLNFTRNNIKALRAFIFNHGTDIIDDPLKETGNNLWVFEKLYSHNCNTRSYIKAIKKYYGGGIIDRHEVAETLYMFLNELINLTNVASFEIDMIQAKKRTTREEIYKRLHMAKDYIQSCYDENISLEDLSKICFLNPFHLLREFKKYFKTTPHKYLTNVRMLEAKKLLDSNKHSIFDTAVKVGYKDVSSFSKLFKNHFGIHPSGYRESAAIISEN